MPPVKTITKKPLRPKKPAAAKIRKPFGSRSADSGPQESPLSHATLRAMYDAMVESRRWAQSRNFAPIISEATAVATATVLHRTDTLAAPADARTLYPVVHPETAVIPLDIAKITAACKSARRTRRGAVVAICPENVFQTTSFQQLLQDAHSRTWPLVCVVLTNSFFNPRAAIPEIDVDGHDAVAIFRVVSESVRRARNHRGPAIIHAHDATNTRMPDPLGDPLIRFERYLAAKGLTKEKIHVVHGPEK